MALLVGKFVCAGQTKSIKESRPICHFDMKRIGRGLTAPGIRPVLKIKTRNPETRRERRKEPRKRRFLGVVSRGEKRGWTMTSAGFFARHYTPKKSSVSPALFLRSPRVSGFLVLTLAGGDFQLHQICDSKISVPATRVCTTIALLLSRKKSGADIFLRESVHASMPTSQK